MNSLEIIEKLAPYVFFVSSLIFIVVVAKHIKYLRQKDQGLEIQFEEYKINEKYDHYSDDDVTNAINELESTEGTIIKKE